MVIKMSNFNIDKKLRYIIQGLLIFTLFWCSAYFQLIPIKLFGLNNENISGNMQVLLSTFSSIILLFILFLFYRKDLKKEFTIFKENFVENIDVGFRYWLIGLFIMMTSNIIITVFFKTGGANNENLIQEMLKKLPLVMVINAGLIGPFNEEIVFRKTLKDIFENKWVFAFLSFLLFGGAHVIGSSKSIVDFLYIIPYGALGAAFALSYFETDTIFTSLTMHALHNTILVILSIGLF